jgi:hypothetical protein
MDKKQIKCKACGTVLSNIYGSVEDPQLVPENGNTKELYPDNKNDQACYFCGPACVSKFTSMTKWNGDKGIKNLNDYTDGSVQEEKDKYGNKNLVLDIAGASISQKKRNSLDSSDFLFPSKKSFPIISPKSITNALKDWGRSDVGGTYEAFVHKLYNFVKRKHPDWLSHFPEETLKKAGIKKD